MHLTEAFIQSVLQYIQAVHFCSLCTIPENQTRDLGVANSMLYQLNSRIRQVENCQMKSFKIPHYMMPYNEKTSQINRTL